MHDWTNTDGKTISAGFGGIEGAEVLLNVAGGQTVRYPMAKLSADSQALARKLGGL